MKQKSRRQRNREIRRNRRTPAEDKPRLTQKVSAAFSGYDHVTAVVVVLLSVFGVAMVFSAGYYQTINFAEPNPAYYLLRQLFFAATGWLIMLGAANFDYRKYYRLAYYALVLSVGMLILVMLVGSSANNAQRWISIMGVRITPSELSKVLMIVFTSVFLVRDPDNIRSFKGLVVLFGIMGLHFMLIISQPNLSTAIVVAAIMMAIMIVAGLHWLFMLMPLAGGVGLYFYIIRFRTPYHWYQRLTSFRDPFVDRQGDGYQVTQGLIALGNGGLKGLGFGRSIAKNLYLPEPQNDFILAIIGEELGYIGIIILMMVYMFLIFRLIMIALRSRDRLGFYLATGVAVMLGLQVVINVAVVTSTMPATGITLPFISYGGTSMWSFMLAMGIALNVSRQSRQNRMVTQ